MVLQRNIQFNLKCDKRAKTDTLVMTPFVGVWVGCHLSRNNYEIVCFFVSSEIVEFFVLVFAYGLNRIGAACLIAGREIGQYIGKRRKHI